MGKVVWLTGDMTTGWARLSTRVMFSSKWLEVRRDQAVRPDGSNAEYDHVVVPGSVTVLAVDGERVAVTRQWIYVHDGPQWRLPAGRIDASDPDPEAAARRELLEETGITADRMIHLGTINCGDSFTNFCEHAFVATGLRQRQAAQLEPGEADLELHWMPFDRVLELVMAGQVPHAGSSYAVLSARVRGIFGPSET
jgi:8-oxo-dGTP pyrophosphatase MutT (NUDIX family)